MSLVAYANSGGEESSDEEETSQMPIEKHRQTQQEKTNSQRNDNFEIGDSFPIEDDEYDIIPNQTHGLTLPPPRNVSSTASRSATSSDMKSTSVLSALPAPQTKIGQVIGFNENDELEDEVKPKAKELADAPLPPSKQMKKQTVKITVPSLDDYDSDEDKPKKKKLKAAEGKSGLFSMLPAPKHGTAKEVGRVLLPHSLKKKPNAPGSAKKPPVQTISKPPSYSGFNNRVADNNDDSDEDDETVSFFSLGQEDKSIGPSVSAMPKVTDKPLATGRNVSSGLLHEPSLRGPWLGPAAPASDLLGPSMQPAGPSHSNRLSASVDVASSSNMDSQEQVASSSGGDEEGLIQPAQYSSEYAETYYPEVGEVQSFMQDEEFLKMQGKRGRGKEDINIIDVHGSDQMSTVDLMKHMTEERDNRSFGKKGKDMPSSQQRKKHQITYLAFQAKEREIELKNQWAQNRQTKRQTQSKYGF